MALRLISSLNEEDQKVTFQDATAIWNQTISRCQYSNDGINKPRIIEAPQLTNLPDIINKCVYHHTIANNVSPMYALILTLGGMNCATRGFFKVSNGSFYTTANAYIIQGANQGYGKSHTTDFYKDPIKNWEKNYNESIKISIKKENQQLNKIRAEIKKIGKKFHKCKDDYYRDMYLNEIVKLEQELEKLNTKELVIFADDATIPALIEILAHQNERIAIMNSELGIIRHLITAKNNSNFLDKILRMFNGDSITFDRSKGLKYILNNPTIALYIATQIEPIRDLLINPNIHSSGAISRTWITIGDDRNIGYRNFENIGGVFNVRWLYQSVINKVLDRVQNRNTKNEFLFFDKDAENEFKEARYAIEHELQQDRTLNPIQGWAKKLCNHISTIAAFIHLHEHPTEHNIISHNTLKNSIYIAQWLSENLKSLNIFALPEKSKEFPIIIGKKLFDKNRTYFTARDITRDFSNIKTEHVKHCLSILIEHGAVYELPEQIKSGPGRPTGRIYAVNYGILKTLLDNCYR